MASLRRSSRRYTRENVLADQVRLKQNILAPPTWHTISVPPQMPHPSHFDERKLRWHPFDSETCPVRHFYPIETPPTATTVYSGLSGMNKREGWEALWAARSGEKQEDERKKNKGWLWIRAATATATTSKHHPPPTLEGAVE
uniref:Uncharacterized protein n=1 Tax=Vespula pensylvanica TaxID=30213 RepID=A0A834PDT9_VESPE|nr:hypothetical protein H0235_000253 [Vespula pensylvanica]